MATGNSSVTESRAPQSGKKYFTVDQANRALPYVSRVADDIAQHYQTVIGLRQRLEQPRPEDDANALRREYEKGMDHLSDLIEELHEVGVELKDFERGLVDFPAVYEGREVYLCWQRGENSILAWHEVDAGFTGRQDVALLGDGA
jgi:hypothetical protein